MFHPSVSEWGFRGGWTGGYFEADYQDNGIDQVRKEMEGISSDRNRACLETKDHFHDEQNQDGDN
jgi:hypothetical protein